MESKKVVIEQFFISSPINYLKIGIKQNRLYFVSQCRKKEMSGFLKGKKVPFSKFLDTKFSFLFEEDSKEFIGEQRLSPTACQAREQIQAYFDRRLKKFHLPLFQRGTDFQNQVWKSLQKIPWGKTKTYGGLALQLAVPGGARAVGGACAKNPFLLLVPCHRVLSQKSLGGFALGLKAKSFLLDLEKEERLY